MHWLRKQYGLKWLRYGPNYTLAISVNFLYLNGMVMAMIMALAMAMDMAITMAMALAMAMATSFLLFWP